MIRGLILPGALVLGTFYLTGVIAAAFTSRERTGGPYSELDPLYVPVVGPFILLGKRGGDSSFTSVMLFDGVSQVTSVALIVAAFFVKRTLLIRDRPAVRGIYPVPRIGAEGAGFGLGGTF